MTLRVPTSTTYSRLERGLAVSLDRVQRLQGQLASQSRIDKLSDDPVGAATGMRLRAQEAGLASYRRSAEDATAVLGTTDQALQEASRLLREARSLAVSGVNGAHDAIGRAAIADQIAGLREDLGRVANTQHLGRAVFGGHRAAAVSSTGTPPTYSYAGDSGTVSRQVSPAVTLGVNVDGRAVFGLGGPDPSVFQVLTDLEAAVRTGNGPATQSAQAALAVRTGAVSTALGQVGAMQNRVQAATEQGETVLESLVEQRSAIEDVDLAATIIRLRAAENGYEAALGAVARADLPSLANFLR